MSRAMVDQVRRFNRTVTERVGALNDHFLGLDRPLGEARLLWEIGVDGCEVRRLRERLVAAMRDVERRLTAASVEIRRVDPESRDARHCLAEYVAELNRRSSRG